MTRHQLKEQDEITTSLEKFVEFAYARKQELIYGGSAVLLIILAIFGWSYYRTSRKNNSQIQLAQVFRAYGDTSKPDKERFEATITEARKTVDSYGSLPAGAIAQYYIGLSQDGLGDSAKAAQSLQGAIDRGDTMIKGAAQFALASIYKKHGEGPKAIEVYKQLYDSGNYSIRVYQSAEPGPRLLPEDRYRLCRFSFPSDGGRRAEENGSHRRSIARTKAFLDQNGLR